MMSQRPKALLLAGVATALLAATQVIAWDPLPTEEDPLIRMPGTQPDQGVVLMGVATGNNACLDCHGQNATDGSGNTIVPGFYWQGSMMAQAARDPLLYASMTVAGQDSIWALGNPNAMDLCERCHFPGGWMGGRSDPPNMSAMTGIDFDGVTCDVCHRMYDPFFETTYDGSREGADWTGYWDEATSLSQAEATTTLVVDSFLASAIQLMTGMDFYATNAMMQLVPKYATYTENGGGQFFVSTINGFQNKRGSFADPAAQDHGFLYSRYHKSKYFCSTCHDVSNPVLANLGLSGLPDQSGGEDLISEQYSANGYFHVERTFSEFMLSAYGAPGGSSTNAEFQEQSESVAPVVSWATSCQDCHMPGVLGKGATEANAPIRPTESTEHPNSGAPLHDLQGGNTWMTYILATLDNDKPFFDPVNHSLLADRTAALTLDMGAGATPLNRGDELMAGSARAAAQLQIAATLKDVQYNDLTGVLSFKLQNNTGHKLISGYPEGRRMIVNIRAYDSMMNLIYEVNPYDGAAGTLKGLGGDYGTDPPPPAPLDALTEAYDDALVYEAHLSSDLTGEDKTFHFVLATGRSKDNRIPPKGFDIAAATDRLVQPVWEGVVDPDYFTAAEYAGGYDEVRTSIIPGADSVIVEVFYQGTSREYMEFLRDEINGTGGTLYEPTYYQVNFDPMATDPAYLAQSDPFFSGLKAWGDTIWDLWYHNHGFDGMVAPVPGLAPFPMTSSGAQLPLFTDGFETGDTDRWSPQP